MVRRQSLKENGSIKEDNIHNAPMGAARRI